MARHNNRRTRYNAENYDPVAADLARAGRRTAYLAGQTGHERPNAAGYHEPHKPHKADRAASKLALMRGDW